MILTVKERCSILHIFITFTTTTTTTTTTNYNDNNDNDDSNHNTQKEMQNSLIQNGNLDVGQTQTSIKAHVNNGGHAANLELEARSIILNSKLAV